ncbi:TetR family transcriptional regulator [Mesoterricola silvestris]|uniref:HTH tetR-type domain-containing protein n=1 Tax=Mesoterricola silvestris TaxID=2927979 RepID=A0AA48GMH6_9BACT|nr:TetR family transcriptional regulator [Mesoterricola silvestris]BDU74142.1 hypothetical protein METEAL_33160 [Mesoterricola silvestris]
MSRPSAPGRAALAPGDLTRWHLLKAAIVVFAGNAYEGATTRKISQEAGAGIAAIWFHFGGKDGLYLEALRFSGRLAARMAARVPDLPAEGDPAPAAREALRALCALVPGAGLPGPAGPRLGKVVVALLARAMASPREGTEAAAAEAIRPLVLRLEACVAALRPDLDEPARAWMVLEIENLLLLPLRRPGLLARAPAGFDPGLPALIAHVLESGRWRTQSELPRMAPPAPIP